MNITFITSNLSKADQLARYFHKPVLHKKIDLVEIQSLDVRKIVEHKAKEAYNQIGTPVLVEDVALTFHALGKLPGPFIKWFLADLKNEGLCKLLDGYQDRSATALVCFGLYDGHELKIFEGEREGVIAASPRGETSFGWNPIFIPDGYTKTWAEMDMEEQNETSMRRLALEKLAKYLEESAQSLSQK